MVVGSVALAVSAAVLGVIVIIALASTDSSPKTVALVRVAPATDVSAVYPNALGDTGCDVATVPPAPEPCLAVRAMLDNFLYNLIHAKTWLNFARDNPGEVARLKAYAGGPVPSMKTLLGEAVIATFQAYAYARGALPIVWPAYNPKVNGKLAAPGGLTVTLTP